MLVHESFLDSLPNILFRGIVTEFAVNIVTYFPSGITIIFCSLGIVTSPLLIGMMPISFFPECF